MGPSFGDWSCRDCGAQTAGNANTRFCGDCKVRKKALHDNDKGHRRRALKYGVVYEPVIPRTIHERDGWCCGICRKKVDQTLEYPHPKSASLDHVLPISLGGDHVPANLQCAHLDCNVSKSNRGAPQQLALIVMTLFVIVGPPASGKSTYVKQHAKPGDITIDFDALANVLTPPGSDPHKHPPHVQAVTKAARQAAIDTAARHAGTVDVYVIHSAPGQRTIAHYRTPNAQFVVIDPGRDVVLARCKRERPWQMAQVAKDWYATVQIQQTSPAGQQTSADTTREW